MTVELAALVTVIGVAVAVGTFFLGRTTAAKSDGRAEGALEVRVATLEREMGNVREHIHGPIAVALQGVAVLEVRIAELRAAIGEVREEMRSLREAFNNVHFKIPGGSAS